MDLGFWNGLNTRGILIGVGPSVGIRYGPDLITNGGFETAGAGGADIWGTWVENVGDGAVADETTVVYAGSHAAKLTRGPTGNTSIYNVVTVEAAKTYRVIYWTQGDGSHAIRHRVYDQSNAADIVSYTASGVTGAAYQKVEFTFTTPTGCTAIRMYFAPPDGNTWFAYADAVSIQKVLSGT